MTALSVKTVQGSFLLGLQKRAKKKTNYLPQSERVSRGARALPQAACPRNSGTNCRQVTRNLIVTVSPFQVCKHAL